MSKVLIDLSILKDVIEDCIYARDTATDRDDCRRFSDQVERLESVIEKSNSKRFSILEWHDWDKKIPDEISEYHPILTRWKDPMLKEFVYDITTKYDTYGCQEWAVLPEVPK